MGRGGLNTVGIISSPPLLVAAPFPVHGIHLLIRRASCAARQIAEGHSPPGSVTCAFPAASPHRRSSVDLPKARITLAATAQFRFASVYAGQRRTSIIDSSVTWSD